MANCETTHIPSSLYDKSIFVLLVANQTCTKTLQSSKILWPELSEKFLSALCSSNDDSSFWKKEFILLKRVSSTKKIPRITIKIGNLTQHDRSDRPIMRHLLCACIFPNNIRRMFWCRLPALIPAHTPLKTAKVEF